jgi:hypothetical protein
MDCRTARLLLEFVRPRAAELEGSDADALEGHLLACAECESLARSERLADEHVGKAVRAVPVPAGAKERLLARLAAERRAKLRRWAVPTGLAAAAAVVLLIVGGWLAWRPHPKPTADLQDFARRQSERFASRNSPEAVEEWFQNQYGIAFTAPRTIQQRRLNYALVRLIDRGDFQGERVPMLYFLRLEKDGQQHEVESSALVYVLSGEQFNLDGLQAPEGYNVIVERAADGSNHTYVIYFSGQSMAPFFSDEPLGGA